MSHIDDFVLFDSIRKKKIEGNFSGSIITKLKADYDFIIFSRSCSAWIQSLKLPFCI